MMMRTHTHTDRLTQKMKTIPATLLQLVKISDERVSKKKKKRTDMSRHYMPHLTEC